jgi:PIN domain nuclease of toxin-antitoxin system
VKVLLDTCTFLWAIGGMPLTPRAAEVFRSPGNDLYLSAASAFEIGVKYSTKRLFLTEPPERLIPEQRAAHGIETLAIDEDSALHVSRLPLLHRDPFDRLLVAQAIVHGMTILTPDPLIAQYPARTLW